MIFRRRAAYFFYIMRAGSKGPRAALERESSGSFLCLVWNALAPLTLDAHSTDLVRCYVRRRL